ncbi:MAG: hypothetical protein ACI94Y_001852 [Maribacter sp.]
MKIDTNSPSEVEDYMDLKDNMYRCIALHGDYVLVGDIAAGTTDVNGVKIIKEK